MSSKTALRKQLKQTQQVKPQKDVEVAKPKPTVTVEKPTVTKVSKGLTKEQKAADPENYVLNPATNKYVKKDSVNGKKIVKALADGVEAKIVPSKIDLAEQIVEALMAAAKFSDKQVKEILANAKITLPVHFPKKWGGKAKEVREEGVPSGALSAYNFYSKDQQKPTKAEMPDAEQKDIMAAIGAKWKLLDEKARKPWIEQAAKDKVRFQTELMAYLEANPNSKLAVKKAEKERVKRTNAFLEFKKENSEMTSDEAKDAWNDMSKEDKKVYAEEAKKFNDSLKPESTEKASEGSEAEESEGSEAEEEAEVEVAEEKPKAAKKPAAAKVKKGSDDPAMILNPKTNRYVKRTSPIGKKLVAAEDKEESVDNEVEAEEKEEKQKEVPETDEDLLIDE